MKPGFQSSLVVRVGPVFVAIPLSAVRETLRRLPSDSLRSLPHFVSGVSIIRGAPVPVIDAARLLGQPATQPADRLVLLRIKDRRLALAVNDVVDVRQLDLDESGLSPLLGAAPEVRQLARLDASLLVVLETSRLVPPEVWASLAADGSR